MAKLKAVNSCPGFSCWHYGILFLKILLQETKAKLYTDPNYFFPKWSIHLFSESSSTTDSFIVQELNLWRPKSRCYASLGILFLGGIELLSAWWWEEQPYGFQESQESPGGLGKCCICEWDCENMILLGTLPEKSK